MFTIQLTPGFMIFAITPTASIWARFFQPTQAQPLIIPLAIYLPIHPALYARNIQRKITIKAAATVTPVLAQHGRVFMIQFALTARRTATAGYYVNGAQSAGQPAGLLLRQVHAARVIPIHTVQKHGRKYLIITMAFHQLTGQLP